MSGLDDGIYTARAFINRDGTRFLIDQLQIEINNDRGIVGNLGLMLGFFIILVASFVFKFNEIAGIIMINIALIGVNMMGLIQFGPVFITAVLAISILIIIMFKK